jgi:hypothetical protein
MGHFGEEFFDLLLEVQREHPELLPASMDVLEDFGLSAPTGKAPPQGRA